MTLNPLAV